MENSEDDRFSPEIHIDMWRHYDDLRQKKNGTFLTANSILVAIVGLKLTEAFGLVVAISLLGMVVDVSWFLLLTRNAAYIEYHRKKAGNGSSTFWKPKSWTPKSGNLDRTLAVAFFIFWCAIGIWSVVKLTTE